MSKPSVVFASRGDFTTRMNEVIITFNGVFVYARVGSSDYCLDLWPLEEPTGLPLVTNIHVDDDRININAHRLGLVNWRGRVWSPTRNPSRQYSFGIPPSRLKILDILSNEENSRVVYSEGFVDMLNNKYPSVFEAMSHIKASKGKSLFALSRAIYVKENNLGLVTINFKNGDTLLWVGPDNSINFVEKTTTNRYLSMCSKPMAQIMRELRDYVSL